MRQTFSNRALERIGTALIHGWYLRPTVGGAVLLRHRNTRWLLWVYPSGRMGKTY